VRKADDTRQIWIDCICISQTSKEEKAAQVAVMDSIFANATNVLVWLGADNEGRSVAAAEVAERIHGCFVDETRFHERHPRETAALEPIDPVIRQSCFDELGSVLPLFECEWFWRLWCVQELALAKQPIIYWGTIVLTWETVLTVTAFIEGKAQLNIAHTGYAGVHNVIMLQCLREQVQDWDVARVPFSRLLSLTRLHGVTEPCDRIFSLLGLDRQLNTSAYDHVNETYANRWRNGEYGRDLSIPPMPARLPLVEPDYSKGIDGLYLSTARALLTRERNLHLLSFVQHEGQVGQGNLPSWVPRWHVNKHRLLTQFDLLPDHPIYASLRAALTKSAIHDGDGVCTTSKRFRSNGLAGGTPIDEFVVDDDGTLRTQGLLLATVAKSCSNARFTADPGHRWLETLRKWWQCVSERFAQEVRPGILHTSSPRPDDDTVFTMFYSALLGGHFRARDVFLGLRTEFDSFRASIRSGRTDDADSFPTTRAFVTQICRSRTVFLTDGGQLGIGPQCLEPGDCVCFLASAAVPLLLRPRSGAGTAHSHWVLVGETYVNQLAGEGHVTLRSSEDDDPTATLSSTPAAMPANETFLHKLDSVLVERAFALFSNIKMNFGRIYYSDLGEIELQFPDREQDSQTFFTSCDSATSGDSGATDAMPYERMKFDIK